MINNNEGSVGINSLSWTAKKRRKVTIGIIQPAGVKTRDFNSLDFSPGIFSNRLIQDSINLCNIPRVATAINVKRGKNYTDIHHCYIFAGNNRMTQEVVEWPL